MKSLRRVSLLVTAACCAVPGLVLAQEAEGPPAPVSIGQAAPAQTLRGAIAQAYGLHPELQAQRATTRATDEQYTQARSAYGPQLSMEVTYGYQHDRQEVQPSVYAINDGWSTVARAVFEQPVFTSGRNYYGVKVAEANIGISRQLLRQTEANLMFDLISAYVGVRRDKELVRIAQENVRLLSDRYDDIGRRYELRESTQTDFSQTGTRRSLALGLLADAIGQLESSRAAYLATVGEIPGELAPLPDLPYIPATLDAAMQMAIQRNPVVLGAEQRERASRSAVELARADFGPTVSLRGTAQKGGLTPYSDDLYTRTYRGEVVVSVPIFQSGFRFSRVREQEQLHAADISLRDQARRDVIQLVSRAWDTLASSRESSDHYREAVESANLAYEGALRQERAGFITTLDVLDLARDLLTAQNNYTVAISNEYLARASLLSAMGLLEAPVLFEDIEAYDPDTHFERVRFEGDAPWTPVLYGLESLISADVERPVPLADPAAGTAKPSDPLKASDHDGP